MLTTTEMLQNLDAQHLVDCDFVKKTGGHWSLTLHHDFLIHFLSLTNIQMY